MQKCRSQQTWKSWKESNCKRKSKLGRFPNSTLRRKLVSKNSQKQTALTTAMANQFAFAKAKNCINCCKSKKRKTKNSQSRSRFRSAKSSTIWKSIWTKSKCFSSIGPKSTPISIYVIWRIGGTRMQLWALCWPNLSMSEKYWKQMQTLSVISFAASKNWKTGKWKLCNCWSWWELWGSSETLKWNSKLWEALFHPPRKTKLANKHWKAANWLHWFSSSQS
jgi:hypothetical protein